MNGVTKILWSGLTGRTGVQAIKSTRDRTDVSIVAGMSRRNMKQILDINGERFEGVKWYQYSWLSEHWITKPQSHSFDVLVDFSHSDVFEQVLDLAVINGTPLISGTSGLSDRQIALLADAAKIIPIFRGGNFRFRVKKFIDEAVELARTYGGNLTLYENFYKGKHVPSETAKVIKQRIFEVTGKTIGIYPSTTFSKNNLVCDWRIDLGANSRNSLRCRTVGFDELAHDILEIAKVMENKPARQGGLYDLDEIWNDIPVNAKNYASQHHQ